MNAVSASIAIVDDHPLVREGLKQLLSGLPDFHLIAEASEVKQAQRIFELDQPDVAIIDLTLGNESGGDLVRWLRERYPDVHIVVLSMQDEALYAERLLRLGISAYVMKSAAESDFIAALRKAARGQRHISPELSERLLNKAVRGQLSHNSDDPLTALTGREIEVFEMIGAGFSTREMADRLVVSMKTIDAHRRHMREKLNLRTGSELVRYAAQWVASRKHLTRVQEESASMAV